VGARRCTALILACLAAGLACLSFVAAGAADRFYPLRLEVMTTSAETEIEFLGGQMVVDRWDYDAYSSTYQRAVTTRPFIRLETGVHTPVTVMFDVFVTIPEAPLLRWRIGKGKSGWTRLEIYARPGSTGGERVLVAQYTHRGEKEPPDNDRTFGFAGDTVTALVQPVTSKPSASEASFRPCEQVPDVPYALIPGVDSLYTSLDLYLPPRDTRYPPPLVVWLHGGGWLRGDKRERPPNQTNLHGILGDAYAVACVNYRLSQVSPFPAQIHDCKAAIRWLRAHAGDYGYDPERIGVWGLSAGGHLAALLGVSGGIAVLEGSVGESLDQSSAVQAVCDYVGPVDLTQLVAQAPPSSAEQLTEFVSQLLGGPLADNYDLAVLASPIFHVTSDDGPFLIVQGDQDELVCVKQAIALHEALVVAGVPAELVVLEAASHVFGYSLEVVTTVREFFDRYLAPPS